MSDPSDRFLLHTGTEVLHKMQTDYLPNIGRVDNTTRTECGSLSTHMSEVSEKEALQIPSDNFCKICFDNG